MRKIDLLDKKIVKLINKHSEEILKLIDKRDELTRSDMQGAVDALVINILNSGINLNWFLFDVIFSYLFHFSLNHLLLKEKTPGLVLPQDFFLWFSQAPF